MVSQSPWNGALCGDCDCCNHAQRTVVTILTASGYWSGPFSYSVSQNKLKKGCVQYDLKELFSCFLFYYYLGLRFAKHQEDLVLNYKLDGQFTGIFGS